MLFVLINTNWSQYINPIFTLSCRSSSLEVFQFLAANCRQWMPWSTTQLPRIGDTSLIRLSWSKRDWLSAKSMVIKCQSYRRTSLVKILVKSGMDYSPAGWLTWMISVFWSQRMRNMLSITTNRETRLSLLRPLLFVYLNLIINGCYINILFNKLSCLIMLFLIINYLSETYSKYDCS